MDLNEKKWLFDIKTSIEEIESYFEGHHLSFEDYRRNIQMKRAVERNLEIIGEAMNRILKQNPGIEIENSKRIVGLRNQIIHAYDGISDENIWSIVKKHIPLLKKSVIKLLNN